MTGKLDMVMVVMTVGKTCMKNNITHLCLNATPKMPPFSLGFRKSRLYFRDPRQRQYIGAKMSGARYSEQTFWLWAWLIVLLCASRCPWIQPYGFKKNKLPRLRSLSVCLGELKWSAYFVGVWNEFHPSASRMWQTLSLIRAWLGFHSFVLDSPNPDPRFCSIT